ncbi:NUDIX hydrolase [Nocardia tengchongensis]
MTGQEPPFMSEIIAVYDAALRSIGAAERDRVYAEGLWYAGAGVLLRSGDGSRVYVHRRTHTKAVFAGMYDCLAIGAVEPGEDPADTAIRELGEELGIELGPHDDRPLPVACTSWQGRVAAGQIRCHLFAYELRYDGPIRHQREEVADGWWWTDAELRTHLSDPRWHFAHTTRPMIPDLLH